MKQDIHPKVYAITVKCSCGHVMELKSTVADGYSVETCSNCHQQYTKKATASRATKVQQFNDKYAMNFSTVSTEKQEASAD